MSTPTGGSGGERGREFLRREIASGKRPVTAFTASDSDEDPDGPLTLMDQILEHLHGKRQRLFNGDNNNPVTETPAGVGFTAGSKSHSPMQAAPTQNQFTPGTAMPTARFQTTAGIAFSAGSMNQSPMQPAPTPNHFTPGPAMPTARFQELVNGPWFNPFQAAELFPANDTHGGRTFMKMFQRPMKSFMALPRGFGDNLRNELLPAVYLIGATSQPYLVAVDDVNGRLYFTHGWERFVLAERLQPEDLGFFSLDSPNKISLHVYSRSGLEKPFSTRPIDTDPDAEPPAGANIHVPSHILGMEFELGPKVSMTSVTMQLMANVWATRKCNNPLYVCKVINSHLRKAPLYFGTRFSAMLPTSNRLPAAVFIAYGDKAIKGAITKTDERDLARLSSGFATVVREYGLTVGDTLIVRVLEIEGGYRIRIFKVPA